jgi:anti-sigma regulatory factor (Ser/Thr protein kinase)
MPPMPAPFALTIPSDLKLLALARAFVETVCFNCCFDDDFCDAVQLATHEALQNVIRHAHAGNSEALLEIQVFPLKDGLEIRLLDQGEPFDVSNVPYLEPGELRVGGRGVFLMRRLMDELASEPRRPQGNVLRMVKRFRTIPRRHLV